MTSELDKVIKEQTHHNDFRRTSFTGDDKTDFAQIENYISKHKDCLQTADLSGTWIGPAGLSKPVHISKKDDVFFTLDKPNDMVIKHIGRGFWHAYFGSLKVYMYGIVEGNGNVIKWSNGAVYLKMNINIS
jgi:hypothetical protein